MRINSYKTNSSRLLSLVAACASVVSTGCTVDVTDADVSETGTSASEPGNLEQRVCFSGDFSLDRVRRLQHWSGSQQTFPSKNMRYQYKHDGVFQRTGFLDPNGCTAVTKGSGLYQFSFKAISEEHPKVDNNWGYLGDISFTESSFLSNPQNLYWEPSNAGFSQTFAMAYHVIQFAIDRLGTEVFPTDKTINLRTVSANPSNCGGNSACSGGDTLYLSSASNHVVVAHELGHFLHRFNVPGVSATTMPGETYNYRPLTESSICVTAGEGSHSYRSIEWNSAAHSESISDFVVALVFNDVHEGRCYTGFGSCRQSNPVGVLRYLCPDDVPRYMWQGVGQDWVSTMFYTFSDAYQEKNVRYTLKQWFDVEAQVTGWDYWNHYELLRNLEGPLADDWQAWAEGYGSICPGGEDTSTSNPGDCIDG